MASFFPDTVYKCSLNNTNNNNNNICRFVGFTDECAVKKAVNSFNGKTLHGRQIQVEVSYGTKELTSPRNGL